MDVGHVLETALAQTPAILVAAGGLLVILRKGQKKIQKQLDGHTTMLTQAKRAQGRYEGYQQAKHEAQNHTKRLTDKIARKPAKTSTKKRK